MPLRTLFNNILVKVIEDNSEIILSGDTYTPVKGKVVVVGDGNNEYEMFAEEGMVIFFNTRDAQLLQYKGEEYYVLSQLRVLAYEDVDGSR